MENLDHLEFKELKADEVDRNFLEILNQLDHTRKTKDMPLEQARLAFLRQNFRGRKTYGLKKDDELIGIASVIRDYRIVNYPKFVAHIEDVAIREDRHGFGYGKILMERIKEMIEREGAYKSILSCSDYNIKFYKKCGYIHTCATMRLDFDKNYEVSHSNL